MSDSVLRLRNIVHDRDILRMKCTSVDKIDDKLLENLDVMLGIMYETGGIGLAANQIGLIQRIVVIDLQENGKKNPIFLINPEILEKSKETKLGPEGCLSIPVNEKSEVRRSTKVKVRYLDKIGNEVISEATGLFAVCLQHEIDHLDGILYIDHLSELRRKFVVEKTEANLRLLEKTRKNR
ncbi:MAG: peptide deformylase [Rickettsiales bacterium]|nr:peptide deformylase [Rickettsiales bacterium]